MVSLAVPKIEYFILSIGKWDNDKSGCMVSLTVLLKPSFFLAYSYRYYVTNRIVVSLPRMLLANHLMMQYYYMKIFFYEKKVFTAGSKHKPAVMGAHHQRLAHASPLVYEPAVMNPLHHRRFWNRR